MKYNTWNDKEENKMAIINAGQTRKIDPNSRL
jgi:hypothetical protein